MQSQTTACVTFTEVKQINPFLSIILKYNTSSNGQPYQITGIFSSDSLDSYELLPTFYNPDFLFFPTSIFFDENGVSFSIPNMKYCSYSDCNFWISTIIETGVHSVAWARSDSTNHIHSAEITIEANEKSPSCKQSISHEPTVSNRPTKSPTLEPSLEPTNWHSSSPVSATSNSSDGAISESVRNIIIGVTVTLSVLSGFILCILTFLCYRHKPFSLYKGDEEGNSGDDFGHSDDDDGHNNDRDSIGNLTHYNKYRSRGSLLMNSTVMIETRSNSTDKTRTTPTDSDRNRDSENSGWQSSFSTSNAGVIGATFRDIPVMKSRHSFRSSVKQGEQDTDYDRLLREREFYSRTDSHNHQYDDVNYGGGTYYNQSQCSSLSNKSMNYDRDSVYSQLRRNPTDFYSTSASLRSNPIFAGPVNNISHERNGFSYRDELGHSPPTSSSTGTSTNLNDSGRKKWSNLSRNDLTLAKTTSERGCGDRSLRNPLSDNRESRPSDHNSNNLHTNYVVNPRDFGGLAPVNEDEKSHPSIAWVESEAHVDPESELQTSPHFYQIRDSGATG